MQIYGNKINFYIRKKSNSHRICLEHQYGRRFIVLEYQYGRRDVMWIRPLMSIVLYNSQTSLKC